MKITYTGEAAFSPAQRKKLDVKFSKLSKLLDRGGEISAHVVLTRERHLRRAEIIVNIYDHQIAVNASESEPVQAVTIAADKLEKQILKMRDKWRDTKRRPAAKAKAAVEAPATPRVPGKQTKSAAKSAPPADGKRVFRVNHHSKQKPMTMEEAMMQFSGGEDYMVYRDADSDRVHVLVKRRDGHFDLIES